jgi:hypothetical protein
VRKRAFGEKFGFLRTFRGNDWGKRAAAWGNFSKSRQILHLCGEQNLDKKTLYCIPLSLNIERDILSLFLDYRFFLKWYGIHFSRTNDQNSPLS